MAITVGSTFQLVNLQGTIAEIGSYIIQNGIYTSQIPPWGVVQSPNAGSLVAFYYK